MSLFQLRATLLIVLLLRSLYEAASYQLTAPFWLHVPKCGTSWCLTLIHWACPNVSDTMDGRTDSDGVRHKYGQTEYARLAVSRIRCKHDMKDILAGHPPYVKAKHSGRAVMLFREPMDRAISTFYYHRSGVKGDLRELKAFANNPLHSTIYVRMLNGIDIDRDVNITRGMISNAVAALNDEFAFVGIMERYNASVCLFHKMFGGSPRAVEFQNTHATVVRRTIDRSSILGKHHEEMVLFAEWGWEAQADMMLYQVAQRRFSRDLALFPDCNNS